VVTGHTARIIDSAELDAAAVLVGLVENTVYFAVGSVVAHRNGDIVVGAVGGVHFLAGIYVVAYDRSGVFRIIIACGVVDAVHFHTRVLRPEYQ